MEKLKNLHNRVIPRVEKMVHDIKSNLQKYSRVADILELDEVTDQVDPIIEEAQILLLQSLLSTMKMKDMPQR